MSECLIAPLKGHIAEVSLRKAETPAEILSVTNTNGFVRSLDVFDKQVFSQDSSNYKLVSFNDLAYNPSRINVGSVALCQFPKGGAVSPMYVVVRCRKSLLPQYLLYFLKSDIGRQYIEHHCVGAVRFQLRFGDLERLELPLPPVDEQERIVRILDEAEAICRLRIQADEQTKRVVPAVFDAMFGSNDSKSRVFPSIALGELCSFVSGATPSTENQAFWSGKIPWVSPKDMKVAEIRDATDHVSDAALLASRLRLLPEGTLLIVIRGMILAHTFPVAIARVPVTINQDMKGLILKGAVIPEYMLWCLNALSPKILSLVSTAGHGTKRIEMESIAGLQIPVPPIKLQQEYIAHLTQISAMETVQAASRKRLDNLFQALLNRAFQGEP